MVVNDMTDGAGNGRVAAQTNKKSGVELITRVCVPQVCLCARQQQQQNNSHFADGVCSCCFAVAAVGVDELSVWG